MQHIGGGGVQKDKFKREKQHFFNRCFCVNTNLLQFSGLGNKISGQRTDMFLKVSVQGLKMSVPKRRNIGKFAEMVSQGTD